MRKLSILNTPLVKDRKKTFLSEAADAADGTLTVESISGFLIDQPLLVGELGNEQSEIVPTNDTTSPSGSTVTLEDNLVFAHPQGTPVTILDYDQANIAWAETVTGSKESLATIDLQADQRETVYTDTAKADGYYFIRFYNSIDETYSSYSDPIPYGDFDGNTVAKAIQYALKRNNLSDFTDFIDHDFCIEEINNCLNYIRGKKKKWAYLQDFDYELGDATRGVYYLDLPSTVWNKSHKAMLAVRLSDRTELTYLDKKDFDDELIGVDHTTVASAADIGDTTLTVDRANDLDDDGTIMVNGYLITYTAKVDATGVLSGIPASGTGAITVAIAEDDNVWQDYEEGKPENYTVYDGKLFWWPMTSSTKANWGIRVDFWTGAPEIDSDADTLDIYRYDMVKYWLTWAVRAQLKNDGMRTHDDVDFLQFASILSDAIKQDIHGQRYRTIPAINTIHY